MKSIVRIAIIGLVIAAGCSSSSSDKSTATTAGNAVESSTTPAADGEALQVLVTNDDGVAAAGINALVQGLVEGSGVDVSVVAPAENQSGSDGKTTEGDLVATDAQTSEGYPATAVAGFPADSVDWALDGGIDVIPDLVMSGVNAGQNIGPLTDVSGTVGAARAAVAKGVPALAVSQGLGDPPDFALGVKYALDWLDQNRAALATGDAPVEVVSINVPTCTSGAVRGIVDVPTATDEGRDLVAVNCESTLAKPSDDVEAFTNGFASESVVPATAG